MRPRILILGGYGNFGKRIAAALVGKGIPVTIAGRNVDKAGAFAASLPGKLAEGLACDVTLPLDKTLARLSPLVVINTCGPFQSQDYLVAESCIRNSINYIDLADGRGFVTGITSLNNKARKAGVAVISGASTVPGLSSAVVEHFSSEFKKIESMKFGISPGQSAERGLATTQAILSYVGKPLEPFPSSGKTAYGWQDVYRQSYPGLGNRWMANCDIPDLDLLPHRYGIEEIRFSAGLELGILHLSLWGLSWIVRAGVPLQLSRFARELLAASNWFNRFGSPDGGMHVILEGQAISGGPLKREWFIIARNGDGPHIPTIPAIVLAEQMVNGTFEDKGAMPCVGLVSLAQYLQELKGYEIKTVSRQEL